MPGEAASRAKRERSSDEPALSAARPEPSQGERARVAQLIANGKTDVAVDVAKQIHKRCGGAASEALLVDAYLARIRSLIERNLAVEARALLDLVRQRYPASGQRLEAAETLFAARQGSLAALLAPLADPALPAEQRAEIENRLRRQLTDPREIAACDVLPPDHPLRSGAAAVAAAFEAVTSGRSGEAPPLGEISRRSPLAPWKLLIRAIDAFYRGDVESCRLALGAIEPDASVVRLVPVLRCLLGEKVALSPAASSLVEQVDGGAGRLGDTLRKLDRALDKQERPLCLALMREAVALCRRLRPELYEPLRQHITIRSMLAGLDPKAVAAALNGPAVKNARFCHLLARACEESHGSPLLALEACACWEEFRKHAAEEGLLPPNGPEAAALYLHMAELLDRVPEDEFDSYRRQFREGRGVASSKQASALLPPDGEDPYFLSPFALFERACQADPCPENFRAWLDWARRRDPQKAETIAWGWRVAHPDDAEPVLFLMEVAESRGALQRAFKLMQIAENLDGLHPEVRRARFRLLVSMAMRHLRQKKAHLAEREIRALKVLPQAQQGDRPAFVAALEWLCGLISGHPGVAGEAEARTIELMGGEAAAGFLVNGAAAAVRCQRLLREPGARSLSGPIAAALGRACALGDDVGVPVRIPPDLRDRLIKEIEADGAGLAPPLLAALGEAALRTSDYLLAYTISSAGLGLDAATQAAMLFLRARSLPPWEDERIEACARAAAELARRRRDVDLLGRIGVWRARSGPFDIPWNASVTLDSEQLRAIVEKESAAREYPRFPPEDNYVPWRCDCPFCRARRRKRRDPVEQVIAELVEELGPEGAAEALAEILGPEPERPSPKRRGRPAEDELPH